MVIKQYEQVTDEVQLQEIANKGLEKLRNVLKYSHSDRICYNSYSYRYSSMAIFYGISESVIEKFVDGDDDAVEPSVKSMMRMIGDTEIGAGALGLIDISSEKETDTYDVMSFITEVKETSDTPHYIKEIIRQAFDNLSSPHRFENYIFNMRISTFIKITRYLGLSVQDIFGGNFYQYCTKLYDAGDEESTK